MTRLESAWAAYQAEPCSHNRRAWLRAHTEYMEALTDAQDRDVPARPVWPGWLRMVWGWLA